MGFVNQALFSYPYAFHLLAMTTVLRLLLQCMSVLEAATSVNSYTELNIRSVKEQQTALETMMLAAMGL